MPHRQFSYFWEASDTVEKARKLAVEEQMTKIIFLSNSATNFTSVTQIWQEILTNDELWKSQGNPFFNVDF
jgi:hypothetical protein